MTKYTKQQREDFVVRSIIGAVIDHCLRFNISDEDGIAAASSLLEAIEAVDPGFERRIQIIEDLNRKTMAVIVKEKCA